MSVCPVTEFVVAYDGVVIARQSDLFPSFDNNSNLLSFNAIDATFRCGLRHNRNSGCCGSLSGVLNLNLLL